MSSAMQRYETISSQIGDEFTRYGFEKKQGVFIKRMQTCDVLVGIQKSWNSSKTLVKFTLNIGVFPKDNAIMSAFNFKKVNKPEHCPLGVRIGYLLPTKRDKWYVITDMDTEDLSRLLDEIKDDLREIAKLCDLVSVGEKLKELVFQPMFFEGPHLTKLAIYTRLLASSSSDEYDLFVNKLKRDEPENYEKLKGIAGIIIETPSST